MTSKQVYGILLIAAYILIVAIFTLLIFRFILQEPDYRKWGIITRALFVIIQIAMFYLLIHIAVNYKPVKKNTVVLANVYFDGVNGRYRIDDEIALYQNGNDYYFAEKGKKGEIAEFKNIDSQTFGLYLMAFEAKYKGDPVFMNQILNIQDR